MDIEAQRLENLRQKQKLLAELNLESYKHAKATAALASDNVPKPAVKRRKIVLETTPSRTSARLAATQRPSYNEDNTERHTYVEPTRRVGKRNSRQSRNNPAKDIQLVENDLRSLVPIADANQIQENWTAWEPTGKPASRDAQGTFHFADFPTFTPNKSPDEMIREGAFGGSYFRPLKSRKLGIVVQDDWKELPAAWTEGLDVDRYLINPNYDPDANKFKVACGQSIEEWEAAGWIAHEYDVRGWYQWYCRFWTGRRCDDDERQVSRWAKCVGPRGRWRRLLLKKYVQMGVKDVFDFGDEDDDEGNGKEVSPVMHQTCHHWAFEVRQGDLDEAWQEFG